MPDRHRVSLPVERLQQAWKECVPGMEFALNFLESNAGIDSPLLLSSPFLLVTLGYYGHRRNYHIGVEEAQRLRHWLLIANAKGSSVSPYLSESHAQK